MLGMRAQFVILVLASILILGSIGVLSPMQTANAGGPICPPNGAVISFQHVKQANARFDNTNSFVSFSEIIENCTSDNEPPTVTTIALISISGCFEFIQIGSQDFIWSFELTTLTLENTNCGDIFVEWRGDGNNRSFKSLPENCSDGNSIFKNKGNFEFATSTLSVDGVVFDTSVDETDAVIARSITMEIKCLTVNG